ncbi:hypothetical protein [Novosphingobium sp.]|uniref:hypothetical protein n=1 Tax=Novosphingobium sp. TaxID=1874826 RepID=UPI001DF092A3|nr:hypothetical protein [Novosphingobium sp.]MBX9662607.1 hypothetical protein [Novosphingobium sp.]
MKRLFGGLLLAAGILIMLTSGLCTVLVIGIGMTQAMRDPGILGAIYLPLMVGGIPFMIGFGLYKWGRSLLRQPEDHNVF